MKKSLIVLALPVMLLAACNKGGANPGPISYKKLQQMGLASLNNGIMVEGTFSVSFRRYIVENGEKTLDQANSYNVEFSKKDNRVYFEDRYDYKYVLDLEQNKTYQKQGEGGYTELAGIQPEQLTDYSNTYYNSIVSTASQIQDKKTGNLYSTKSTITYESGDSKKTNYLFFYEDELFASFNKSYYYSKEVFFSYNVIIDSYTGSVPVI